jgi:hypothetical protein
MVSVEQENQIEGAHDYSRDSTGPISIVPGCPRQRSRLISRAQSKKSLCKCKTLVGAFRKSVRSSIQKLKESPGALTKKRSKEKT